MHGPIPPGAQFCLAEEISGADLKSEVWIITFLVERTDFI